MTARPSLARGLFAAALCFSLSAAAASTDRIALEQRAGETPADVALQYLEACLRLGAAPSNVRPLNTFEYADKRFVRLVVDGPPPALRCLNEVSNREAIDGTIHWLDGSSGGLLLSSANAAHEVIVADDQWLGGTPVPTPSVDQSVVDALSTAQGREQLRQLPIDAALVQLGRLAQRGGPAASAGMEEIAATDPRWGVRRTALLSLNPVVSAATILERALKDDAWQVRMAGVDQLRAVSASNSPRADAALEALLRLAEHDPDWSVQRQAIWALPSGLIREHQDVLRRIVWSDHVDGRVRGITLEVLAGIGKVSRGDMKRALGDRVEEVRAVGAEILASDPKAEDVGPLWRALNDHARVVRIAASPILYRMDDDTIGPDLWQLYLQEADLVDAAMDFERAILDALSRHPYPGLGEAIGHRLHQGGVSPEERRLLARTLAFVDPALASTVLEPDLASEDLFKRSVALDAAPDTPQTRTHRKEALTSSEPLLRASALLGLCRSATSPLLGELAIADLDASPLGTEARLEAPRCGAKDSVPRFKTRLMATEEAPSSPTEPMARWPAVLGMLLLAVHVLATKLRPAPPSGP